jgi:hypothetical protein
VAAIEFVGRSSVAFFLLFAGIGVMTAVLFFFLKPGRKPPADPGEGPEA